MKVKQRSPPAFRKLRQLVYEDAERAAVVFVNEFHAGTAVERLPGEAADDRAQRAIRTAAKWSPPTPSLAQSEAVEEWNWQVHGARRCE